MTEPVQHPAGLRLFTSNRLEHLAALLADAARVPLDSPFEPEAVIVQSQGMARWLQFELARHLGVCANVRFPFPRSFSWELFRAADPGLPAESERGTDLLLWCLMRLLPEHAGRPAFEPVAHYLANDPEGRKRYQLARRLAHLFDQYLIFRPEMISRWETGNAGRGEEWQAALWQTAAKELDFPRPARLRESFASALRQGSLGAGVLPSRLSIFGISALPPFYVELFEQLAQRIPVSLFLLQPTPEYWGDLASARSTMRTLRLTGRPAATPSELHCHAANRLLASLGGQGRDFLNVLLDVTEFDVRDHSTPPGAQSLLQHLQSDIFLLRDSVGVPIAPSDDSLQIHSCHSPLRELEVLRDQMLAWFEADPELAPQHILVIMPDIEAYAPLVEAVFGAGERDGQFIPYSIADRGTGASSPVLGSFLALLQMAGGRFGAASVLALLESGSVRERFGFSESDLPLLRRWIEDAGIRWGRDARHREQLGLPALPETTWRQGLDRLKHDFAEVRDGNPIGEGPPRCAGMEIRHGPILERFVAFVETMFDVVGALEQARPVAAWVELFRDILGRFFPEDDATEEELGVVRGALWRLENPASQAGFQESIPLAVVLEHLAPALAEDHLQSGFITGRVTFGALKPMRSIPFQVICLIGMSDGSFPRADIRTGFDLMAQSPRLGDQSRREDDRYLFLETLLSARQRFYLSYVGQSIRDNSPAPPSVLVSELLDYVDHGFVLTSSDTAAKARKMSGHLVVHHRLQAFHEDYFRPGSRLFSYSAENFAGCVALRGTAARQGFVPQSLPPPDATSRSVPVEKLIAFFENPAKYFAIERLNLRLPRPGTALADRELIEPDALEAYDLRRVLLDRKLAGFNLDEARMALKASGRLPLGSVGDLRHREFCEAVEAFHERLRPFLPTTAAEPITLELVVGEFRVVGTLPRPTPAGQLLFRPATLKAKDFVRAWIQHVVWHATPGVAAGRTVLIGERASERSQPSLVSFAAVPDASGVLAELLALYWSGLTHPLKFAPATSLAYVEAAPDDAVAAARKAWASDEYHRGDDSDDYRALCFADWDPEDPEFALVARSVLMPLLKYREVLE